MTISASPKVWFASAFLGASALLSLSTPAAIAQESEVMAWPTQITNNFSGFTFTSDPYGNAQTITLSDENKQTAEFRTVQDEAYADAPRSESYNSGFKIKLNGIDNSDSAEAEATEN
ncbi:hypothetical protein Lepto7376_2498 [[Leptolyngbya] sp. PCC 7376]|uniref:hypothetical protein n=1 Tax=[Leptolyngbya] sp. PCC 7376 TaxID=111781 RepID=UPI00029F3944|nr:hypothetical protein [[Leptolyngbya] sp. PCC 7376]AFY38773.1 hypothetical protein Lepto7376_2498 [[Leptolyngbya] sp. PCC 7376]